VASGPLRQGVLWYLGVTLGVPLLHGSTGEGFAAHALSVLGVAALLCSGALLLRAGRAVLRRRAARPEQTGRGRRTCARSDSTGTPAAAAAVKGAWRRVDPWSSRERAPRRQPPCATSSS